MATAAVIDKALGEINAGRRHSAEKLLGKLRQSDPAYPMARFIMGLLKNMSGRPEESFRHLDAALQMGVSPLEGLPVYAEAIAACSDLSVLDKPVLRLRDSLLAQVQIPASHGLILEVLHKSGIGAGTWLERREWLVRELLLPVFLRAWERDQHDLAFAIELLYYNQHLKQNETEACFSSGIKAYQDAAVASGLRLNQALGPVAMPVEGALWRMVFLLHHESLLAHVDFLINMLRSYLSQSLRPYQPIVFTLGGRDEAMRKVFADMGVMVVAIGEFCAPGHDSMSDKLLLVRKAVAENQVHALAWISSCVFLPFAFAMGLAPVQIWWAMKYHSLDLPLVQHRLTGGGVGRYHDVDGDAWRNGVMGLGNLYDEHLHAPAAVIREKYAGKIILGTLGREEKLRDPQYLAAVCCILQENPDTVFLWTGRVQERAIQARFEAEALEQRTFFIGWIDTRLYAQVLDIFLDSYPFPCGFTAIQTMAAGKPIILHDTREAHETGVVAMLSSILDGRDGDEQDRAQLQALLGQDSRIPICQQPQQMVQHARRLIDDAAWRQQCGEAAQKAAQRYYGRTDLMGLSFSAHLMEMLASRFPAAMPIAGQMFACWDEARSEV